jgi:hypothetical protein
MRRSSTKAQPDPVFFTDRDLGRVLPAQLTAGGMRVEAYHQHFELDNVADGDWLRYVGARGWIALSHNKAIRYERDELDDLMEAQVKAFFIIGKGPHAAFASAFLRAHRKMIRMARKHPEPFVAKVYQERDDVELWVTYSQWLQDRRLSRR